MVQTIDKYCFAMSPTSGVDYSEIMTSGQTIMSPSTTIMNTYGSIGAVLCFLHTYPPFFFKIVLLGYTLLSTPSLPPTSTLSHDLHAPDLLRRPYLFLLPM